MNAPLFVAPASPSRLSGIAAQLMRDERPHAPRRMVMDVAGDHLLADPLSPVEDRGIGLGHPRCQRERYGWPGLSSNTFVVRRGRQPVTRHVFKQRFRLKRQREITRHQVPWPSTLIDVGIGGHQHDRQVHMAIADFLEQGDAVSASCAHR